MALSANTVWEIRTDGDDTNGGGYVTGSTGTDFTDQAGPQYTFTTATTAGADAVFLDAQAAADMVGNILLISGGTNFIVGSYQVLSVVAGVSMTLDRTCTTGAGALGTAKLGGSRLTLAAIDDAMIAGNICYVKAGTYTLTTTWALTLAATTAASIRFIGFSTNRNPFNTDTKPLITTATDSTALITGTAASTITFRNLSFSNTAATRSTCCANATTTSAGMIFDRCVFDGFTFMVNMSSTDALRFSVAALTYCEIKNCTTGGILNASGSGHIVTLRYCWIHDGVGTALSISSGGNGTIQVFNSIISNWTSRGLYTPATTANATVMATASVFYNNLTSNIETDGTSGGPIPILVNNIIFSGGVGVDAATAGSDYGRQFVGYNAFGGQTGLGARVNFKTGEGDITLTADPFVDAAGNNFALNNVAGGGALLRALGFPSAFPSGLTANYADVGPAQHQDAGGGSTTVVAFKTQRNLPDIRV